MPPPFLPPEFQNRDLGSSNPQVAPSLVELKGDPDCVSLANLGSTDNALPPLAFTYAITVAEKGNENPVQAGIFANMGSEDSKSWLTDDTSKFHGNGSLRDGLGKNSVLGPYKNFPDEPKGPSVPSGLQFGSRRLGNMECQPRHTGQNERTEDIPEDFIRSNWNGKPEGVPEHKMQDKVKALGAHRFEKPYSHGEVRLTGTLKGCSIEKEISSEDIHLTSLFLDRGGEVKSSAVHSTTLRSKDYRSDFSRGHHVSNQRIRIQRRTLSCRRDIEMLTPSFLSIFESLIPTEEEIAKQNHLLSSLRKLIKLEWPDAKLYLYGSCANSFGVSNSDIDVCLHIGDTEMSKVDVMLKLADILESGNLQNIQALTHARVPIVKLKDPETGLSCDICINNLLAVVNTKLLKDYAKIDRRLRQLAFIVKHWAKRRRVNETYQGTLSSYAYVIMCIHLLQQRRPAILPCLQRMESTYYTRVDNIECAYFDQVERLQNYGARNTESVAKLVWAFFSYWAYHHDYTTDVISVRTGSIISKHLKDWTKRIGNDRHLICIEDPFELSHDLGRVVDRNSIKILREEFERAANIMQFDANPTVALFEPYVPPPGSSLELMSGDLPPTNSES